ncbi:hypothetical protein LINGRAHAP2_LOCUS7100 [Linum grandiflorum]
MVECDSEVEAKRILGLDRFYFGTSKVMMDRWMSCAGSTDVLFSQGIRWLFVKGIPLHLVSPPLYEQIGRWCGELDETNSEMCPLGAVRVKVRMTKATPETVRLIFKNEEFTVAITEERCIVSAPEKQRTSKKKGKDKNNTQDLVAVNKYRIWHGSPRKWQLVKGQSSRGVESRALVGKESSGSPSVQEVSIEGDLAALGREALNLNLNEENRAMSSALASPAIPSSEEISWVMGSRVKEIVTTQRWEDALLSDRQNKFSSYQICSPGFRMSDGEGILSLNNFYAL